MQSVARRNIHIVALRAVPEFIQRATQGELTAARKGKIDRLKFFKDAYAAGSKREDRSEKAVMVKRRRNSVVSSIWKSRAAEMKAIGQQLAQSGTDELIRTRCSNRLQLILQHIDFMTVHPEAFMDSTGTSHHPSRKAAFWPAVQEPIAPQHTFQLWGYPHVQPSCTLHYAIDIMNVVHMPLDKVHSRTVGMHVRRCANAAVRPTIRNHGHQLTELNLHLDYPPWVVRQKKATQSSRDYVRSRADNSSNEPLQFDINAEPPATAAGWNIRLANRKYKWALTVSVGSNAFLTAARLVFKRRLSCRITFAGSRLAITPAARLAMASIFLTAVKKML